MNTWRSCLSLGALFYATNKAFDALIPFRPPGEFWDMAYYGAAATVDWMMFKIVPRLVGGKLSRDVQALCIAYIVANAFGFERYVAYSPPSVYNWIIRGIDYALAIRLIFTGGRDALHNFDCRGMVRGVISRCPGHEAKKA